MSQSEEMPSMLTDEMSAELFLIAVNSVTKDNGGTTPLQATKDLGTKLVEFAEIALREYSLLTLIQDGQVEPFLLEGELAFRVTGKSDE